MQKIQIQFRGWGQSWPLGELASAGGHILFEYSPEARVNGVEFSSIRMPLTANTYLDFPQEQLQLPGLIADSLPDGWGLLLMDRFFRKNFNRKPHEISALDRLAFMGDRTMGAFTFAPATDIGLTPQDMALTELAKEIRQVVADKDTTALKQLLLIGGSPHGARPKALVQYHAQTESISTLANAPGMPWLVKFPGAQEHKEVCAIEYLYSEMARKCGLDMPATRYFDLGSKTAAFGIERFDRYDGMRVPIHTLAGALNIDFRVPNSSYQTLLRATRALTHSEVEVVKAYERCVFNVIFNNRDDHTKNFSFRMNNAWAWELAPCYDLTFCPGPRGQHQMDVEGEGLHPARKHLLQLATSNGINQNLAKEVIERFVAVALQFKSLAKNHPIRTATRTEIAKAINENCDRMA